MRKFKSVRQAQRIVTAHAAIQNLFNLGRHLIRAQHYRNLRMIAFSEWSIGDPEKVYAPGRLSPPVILDTRLDAFTLWTLDSFSQELCNGT